MNEISVYLCILFVLLFEGEMLLCLENLFVFFFKTDIANAEGIDKDPFLWVFSSSILKSLLKFNEFNKIFLLESFEMLGSIEFLLEIDSLSESFLS